MLRLRHGYLATKVGISGLLLAILACAHAAAPVVPSLAAGRTITFDQLKGSLASLRPCTVVFDIDDTTVFVTSRFPSQPASDRTSRA